MIKLTQEEIAEMVGFNSISAFTTLDRSIGAQLQLPKGEIAKLPTHVQQTLPDIQCQRDAFYRKFSPIF